jgi:dTDP-4-dehydrorhamnose 3,5-epimerase
MTVREILKTKIKQFLSDNRLMKFTKTTIEGVLIVEPEAKVDSRGYFERVYCHDEFKKQNINFKIVQINRSLSLQKGTIRGIHMQIPPKSEDKFVQCLQGEVFDVAVDLRKGSKTFGKWIGTILTPENKKMVFLPKGIGHAIQAIKNNSIIQYPVSEFFSPQHAIGIRWNDPFFKIDWPIKNKVIVSDVDANWPLFSSHEK